MTKVDKTQELKSFIQKEQPLYDERICKLSDMKKRYEPILPTIPEEPGRWAGKDIDEMLEIVYATRGKF